MRIKSQHGIVASLMIQPFAGSGADNQTRDRLLEQAARRSSCPPAQRMDIFDETLLTFGDLEPALDFLLEVIDLVKHEYPDITNIRSGLCCGEYFLHGEQIYGAAVNLATQLSFMSRQNELLTGGIEHEKILRYVDTHGQVEHHIRDSAKLLVSVSLFDADSTLTLFGKSYLHIKSANCHKVLTPRRNIRISIGRLPTAEIFIDSEHVSRQHATLILKDDDLYLEDHSSNGTFIYMNDEEIFLNRNACHLGKQGIISCGLRRSEAADQSIFFEFRESSEVTGEIRPIGLIGEE